MISIIIFIYLKKNKKQKTNTNIFNIIIPIRIKYHCTFCFWNSFSYTITYIWISLINKCKSKCTKHNWKLGESVNVELEWIQIHLSKKKVSNQKRKKKKKFLMKTKKKVSNQDQKKKFLICFITCNSLIHLYHNSKSILGKFRVKFQVKFMDEDRKIQ